MMRFVADQHIQGAASRANAFRQGGGGRVGADDEQKSVRCQLAEAALDVARIGCDLNVEIRKT
jgi:hypothetical protein